MPDLSPTLVTNTTPILALAAATGSLEILHFLYARVVVPFEVAQEIRSGGRDNFGVSAFDGALTEGACVLHHGPNPCFQR